MAKRRKRQSESKALKASDGVESQRADREERMAALEHLGFSIDTWVWIVVFAAGTFFLKSLIFAPINLWPVAFICLVPWLLMVGAAAEARRVYVCSYLMGLAFFAWNMRWLYEATGVGYVALALYLALYFPLMACPLRHAVRRRRMPLAVVVPLVWVGGEMLRAVVFPGFPWFFLSHGVHKVLTLIQVSDIAGAYGVSFVIAAANGAVVDLILARIAARRAKSPAANRRQARFSVIVAATLLVVSCVYGQVQLHRNTSSTGPRIAVVQGDFISTVSGGDIPEDQKMAHYLSMMRAASEHDPDLVLLPESPWWMFLNPEARGKHWLWRDSFVALRDYAMGENAYVVTGCGAEIKTPYDLQAKERRYNSAMVFNPQGEEPGRYDKIHLVHFGEVVPFRFTRLRFLYFWINAVMPFSGPDNKEFSYFRGDEFRVFEMGAASQSGKTFRFGIPICYEDVMPYVSREFVCGGSRSKRADFLLNISNDGWFGRGIQQPQHLAICVFRAVENRVGIARSVNTGISAFIRPSGEIETTVRGDPANPWPGKCGFEVADIIIDSRFTLYSRYGNWFSWCCVVLWLALYVDYMTIRVATRAEE